MVESFRAGFRGGVEKAASLGVEGIQAYATYGELAPENMTAAKIKETLDIVYSHGMVFSAICGDFCVGFADPEKNKIYVEKSKRVLDLAKELNCNVVTTHIGVVPVEENEKKKIMREACHELAVYADSIGSAFAVETGPELATVLCDFLDSLDAGGVRVNFDPANLVMVTGDDPVQAVYRLRDYIVHTHAKDGIKLLDRDPEIIYGIRNIEEVISEGEAFREVPLGQGNVPFPAYLAALEKIDYRGYLTIEREVGEDPVADITLAADFLKNLMK